MKFYFLFFLPWAFRRKLYKFRLELYLGMLFSFSVCLSFKKVYPGIVTLTHFSPKEFFCESLKRNE